MAEKLLERLPKELSEQHSMSIRTDEATLKQALEILRRAREEIESLQSPRRQKIYEVTVIFSGIPQSSPPRGGKGQEQFDPGCTMEGTVSITTGLSQKCGIANFDDEAFTKEKE